MKNSRRKFLQIAGVTALGACANPLLAKAASVKSSKAAETATINRPEALTAKRWAIVIDVHKFHSEELINKCSKACTLEHNIPFFHDKRHEILSEA